MTRTIHFIYSVPRPSNIVSRVINKLIAKSNFIPPLYRNANDFFIPWRKPIRAPHSISYNLLSEFKKYGKVKFYSLYEHTVCDLKKDDILIGVPTQDHSKVPWEKPDSETVLMRTLKRYPNHRQTYIIMPYSNDPLFVGWANTVVEKYGKNMILLSGKIWFDNWEKSPWKKYHIFRRVRVDMGINPADYPVVKKTFNPKGKRGFLYVGHASWYKNTIQLEKIAESMPGFEFGHIGSGHIKGWKKIVEFADLNEHFMTEIVKTYDFFVNVSWDAQVTTVLEQMCFGLVVACTPESGYTCPSLIQLSCTDTAHNVYELEKLQEMDEEDLLRTAKENREYATTNHSWKQFCDTIISFMGL